MSRAVDPEQLERKLRPIYDAIDSRNPKTALKLANNALTKYPNNPAILATKAIAIDRLGKREEAVQVCLEALEGNKIDDDHTLHLLSVVLKPARKFKELTAAYEAAAKLNPSNVDIAKALFACYCRDRNLAAQRSLAQSLSKATGDPQYTWWIVVTWVLQAKETLAGSAGGLPADKILALAEGLMARVVGKEGGVKSYEQLLLYLDVLQAQGKYQHALDLLSGQKGSVAGLPAERRSFQAGVHLAMGGCREAANLYREALLEYPDGWAYLQLYLDALLPSTRVPGSGTESALMGVCGGVGSLVEAVVKLSIEPATDGAEAEAGLKEAEETIRQLQKAAERPAGAPGSSREADGQEEASQAATEGQRTSLGGGLMRGPWLAEVELAARKLRLGVAGAEAVGDAILRYFQRLGHLVSCPVDIRAYTSTLPLAVARDLVGRLQAHVEAAEAAAQLPANKLLRLRVGFHQIEDDLGLPELTTSAQAVDRAVQLMRRYVDSLPLTEGLDPRERGPADDLVPLATSALMSAHCLAASDASLRHLLQAMMVLGTGLTHRPRSGAMLLPLTAIRSLLACPAAASAAFARTDCKHIQLDTLAGHHLVPVLAALRTPRLGLLLQDSLRLFRDHERDAGESLAEAFAHGSYTKVVEFVDFANRLGMAHTYARSRATLAAASVSEAAATSGLAEARLAAAATLPPRSFMDRAEWQRLRWNEDLATRPAWLPPAAGGVDAALVGWWEGLPRERVPGFGRCWWASTGAAESDHPSAAAAREGQQRALRRTWLLPHLILSATAAAAPRLPTPAPSGPAPSALSEATCIGLEDGVRQLAEAVGCDAASGTDLGSWLEAAAERVAAGGAAAEEAAVALEVAVFAAADSLRAASAATAGAPELATAQQQCSTLEKLLGSCSQLLVGRLEADGQVAMGRLVRGGGVLAAAVFTHQQSLWAALVLEAWTLALSPPPPAASKKSGKKSQKAMPPSTNGHSSTAPPPGQTPPHSSPNARPLLAAVRLCAGALAAACTAVKDVLKGLVAGDGLDAGVKALVESVGQGPDGGSGSDDIAQRLFGWESKLKVEQVMRELLQEQQGVINHLLEALQSRLPRLQRLATA